MRMTTIQKLSAVSLGLSAFLCASQASAGEFGDRGQFIISADRLFPLLSFTDVQTTEYTPPYVKDTYQQSSFSLLLGGTPPTDTFYTLPRLGLDYVVTSHLTVGGDLVLYTTLGTSNSPAAGNGSGPTTFAFGFAPRVGYVIAFNDVFAFWPRGGVSWYTTSSNGPGNGGSSINQLALDVDPQFVITPVSHFGFTVGLTTDIPLTGGHSDTNAASVTQSQSADIFYIGATVGILGYL
jgi:hypothetical protein